MQRSRLLLGATIGALALFSRAPAAQAEHTDADKKLMKWSDVMGKGSTFQLYGFLRLDIAYDDSRFNDPQIPGYVRSEDPAAPAGVGAPKDSEEFTMHPRLTRLGFDFAGPEVEMLSNAKLTGKVEIDFYNIGLGDSDSRSALRMRHAYLKLGWNEWEVLAGQTSDIISPLYPAVNHSLLQWGAGNLGDRRPQLRASYKSEVAEGKLDVTAGLGLSGAVASTTVVGGLRSGENSGLPMFSARVGWDKKLESGGKIQAGIWGHVSEERFDPAGGTNEMDFDSHSIGLDVHVPIYEDRLWARGEFWTGENVDDVRGGIFQGVNAATNSEIESKGGWIELGFKANDWLTLHGGFTMDDPKDGDLPTNGRSSNESFHIALHGKFDALRVQLEFQHWETEYIGLESGDANRIALWIAYYF